MVNLNMTKIKKKVFSILKDVGNEVTLIMYAKKKDVFDKDIVGDETQRFQVKMLVDKTPFQEKNLNSLEVIKNTLYFSIPNETITVDEEEKELTTILSAEDYILELLYNGLTYKDLEIIGSVAPFKNTTLLISLKGVRL
jgi:hypothetical protein